MTRYSISQPVTQVEAPRLLKGEGRYTDDVKLPFECHAVFLRSPHAHAKIVSIDTKDAKQRPGVIDVLTGEDVADDNIGYVAGNAPPKRSDGRPGFRPPREPITRDRVMHVGQLVAMVIAETINQAKDAAEAIDIEYEILQPQIDPVLSSQPDADQFWDGCENNESFISERGDAKATEVALNAAPHVVKDTMNVTRVTANTMEPRAVVASYDPGQDHYTVYACQQRPFVWRNMMTKKMFDIEENQMTVIAGDVGGSFGMKGGLYPEVPLTAWAARRVGRPVKWVCERSEGHVADDQARDVLFDAELGFDDDGKFLAYRARAHANVGAFLSMNGFGTPNGAASYLCSTYDMPTVHGYSTATLTNTVPMANYRGPSGTPGSYVQERLIDLAAKELDLDPSEIRRRNYIPADAMPAKLPNGDTYDCGEFEVVMDKCLELAEYDTIAERRAESQRRGKLYGVGVSSSVDPSGSPAPEAAQLRFDPGGTVTVMTASTAGGQSHATIYTQIVSETLGIDAEKIRVVEGDTSKHSFGSGTGAARTATICGSVVLMAAEKTREKARKIAAHMMEAADDDIEFDCGEFKVAGTDRSVTLADVVDVAFEPKKVPPGMEFGLYETASWSPETTNIPNTYHVCEIEIDPDTGTSQLVRYSAVHDVGVELNPILVDGQVVGGIAQGVGQALMEEMIYDTDGQVITGSFMDYCMPRASDFCEFKLDRHPVPTATNPLGVKGAGEGGTVGALAAVMNAINDALEPLGVRNLGMPATPERVWKAIQEVS
ncbi:MAG: carbon monoxide dehydrogenase [Rhodospirillaceae bacterium]|nr:carbon monoxide dehydrogenase [Rhodospirillaceae bacterium]|tara:strand:- start:11284 stop:13602 length:2319 start_codon:yes stop_codon:yes gene_type:complete